MNETYIKEICRKLKCTKAKRREIQAQLKSDIGLALESGESMDDIMTRMGSPLEVAAEFNSNFSPKEQKAAKRQRLFLILAIVAAVLLLLIAAIYWCLPKYTPLAGSTTFDQATVESQAKQIIDAFNAERYDAVFEQSDATLQKALGEDGTLLKDAKAQLGEDWGAFVSYGTIYSSEVHQMGQTAALVQINASYENISVTYTLSFDSDMQLNGFYMK